MDKIYVGTRPIVGPGVSDDAGKSHLFCGVTEYLFRAFLRLAGKQKGEPVAPLYKTLIQTDRNLRLIEIYEGT